MREVPRSPPCRSGFQAWATFIAPGKRTMSSSIVFPPAVCISVPKPDTFVPLPGM
jgi:hypothetical protein